ncbi:hypothetical protein ABZ904_32400 [Streptomyces sp. NPDC046900]|uniref:hypothetical protein n=1 Tax=Streptomyces sp. NPDC046900 TaxID=3155473 RepID=UPI0033DE6841
MDFRSDTSPCAAMDDTCPRPAAQTSEGGLALTDPSAGPVQERVQGAWPLQAAWGHYRTQVSWLCTLWGESSWSAAPAGRAWNRQSWATVVEQHDALIRRLGDWPALDVWNADLAVAVQAAEAQLASLLSAWLTLEPTLAAAHERMRMALVAKDVRRLGQALSALGPAQSAGEPADG